MNPDLISSEPSPQETALQHAIELIQQENFADARDVLTKLLRYEQDNPVYWVWLSAAMETQKERLYCLQAAYKLDPTDATARRGLILMGALPPDDSIEPFPMNHPRPWENKLKLADEKPKPKGLQRLTSNPAFKMAAIFGGGALLIFGAIAVAGFLYLGSQRKTETAFFGTPRPTVTTRANPNAPAAKATLPPLVAALEATYTPTVIYEATEHVGMAQDSYRGAMRSYKSQQWDMAGLMMEQVATTEPGSADALFFAGETRRLSGKYAEALDYYNLAIETNAKYAPGYLGRARANLALKSRKDILPDLNQAIELDPAYAAAYMERAQYYERKNNFDAALADMAQAVKFAPDSPLVYIQQTHIQLAAGQNQAALASAQKANQLDVTSLPGYLALGMAYYANGQIDAAVQALNTYILYQPDDATAFTVLGAVYLSRSDYDTALTNLQQAVKLDNQNDDAFYWLGELYLKKGESDKAVINYKKAFDLNGSFRNGEALARAYLAVQDWGNANFTVTKVQYLIKTDEQQGKFLYINALANQNLGVPTAAVKSWNALLALPEGAVPPEVRAEAQKQLAMLTSPTPTLPITSTP